MENALGWESNKENGENKNSTEGCCTDEVV